MNYTPQPREHRPQTVCLPSKPLVGVGSKFVYRDSASTNIRITFARIARQTREAFAANRV